MPTSEDGFQVLDNHATLLFDGVRVESFARAVRATVTEGDVVADIGAGTGILALLAARAGASRVFAVERGPMAAIAIEAVRENGLEEIVEVIRRDARDVEFPVPPDVIVSETLGSFGIDEDIVGLLGVVKKRCVPEVRMVPSALRIVLGVLDDAALASDVSSLDSLEGIRMRAVRERLAHRAGPRRMKAEDLLGKGVGTGWIELGSGVVPDFFRASIPVERVGEANALAAWFEARLAEGVTLATGPEDPATHWAQICFPLDPPQPCGPGDVLEAEICPRVIAGRGLWSWQVRRGDDERSGDMMRSAAGGMDDLLGQLGLGVRGAGAIRESPRLAAWAAAFGGRTGKDIDAMAALVREAHPRRYANIEDAREEIRALLRAAGALD
jgi:hypothetical protein